MLAITPTVTVFLLDRAYAPSATGRVASYGPGELPAEAQRDLLKLLADQRFSLHGGDIVFGSTISAKSNATREVFLEAQKAPVVQPPVFTDFEAPPAPPISQIDCADYMVQVEKYNERVAAETARRNRAVASWKTEQAASDSAFRQRITEQVKAASFPLDRNGTDVAGALEVASDIFAQYREVPGARLQLLIWSDLTETTQHPLRADLHGVTTVIARYRRDDIDDQAGGQKEWEPRLRERGATKITFLRWSATSTDTILSALSN